MWTCRCGEQIEDQFDACWRCAEKPSDEPLKAKTKERLTLECQRCKIALEYFGKRRFHVSRAWELMEGREIFDIYGCPRCGHMEFFLEDVGKELRPNNVVEENSTTE